MRAVVRANCRLADLDPGEEAEVDVDDPRWAARLRHRTVTIVQGIDEEVRPDDPDAETPVGDAEPPAPAPDDALPGGRDAPENDGGVERE